MNVDQKDKGTKIMESKKNLSGEVGGGWERAGKSGNKRIENGVRAQGKKKTAEPGQHRAPQGTAGKRHG